MEHEYIKLSEYARKKSITYRTAWNHFKNNLIQGAFIDETGHVCIPINNTIDNINNRHFGISFILLI